MFHVIVCIFLILVVLLQQGKGADWAGAFGGGGIADGVRRAQYGDAFLSEATTAAAIIFMITSLALTILISQPGSGHPSFAKAPNRPNQHDAGQPAAAGPTAASPASSRTAPAPRRRQRREYEVTAVADGFKRSRAGQTSQSRSGGIGRHTILRGWRREACGFESRLRHNKNQ